MRTWFKHLVTKARRRVFHVNAFQIFCLFITLGLVLAVRGTWVYTDSSTYCGTCHPKMAEHWGLSTHRTVACRQCHIEPGMKGAIEGKVTGLHNICQVLDTDTAQTQPNPVWPYLACISSLLREPAGHCWQPVTWDTWLRKKL